MKTTKFTFKYTPDHGKPCEFPIYVTDERLESSKNTAWVLAVNRANRLGPYSTMVLTLIDEEELDEKESA